MNELSRSGEAACPTQLLDLVYKERDWFGSSHGGGGGGGGRGSSEENKLELTLGPPGDNWSSLNQQHTCDEQAHESSLLSLGHGAIKAQIISSSLDHHHHSGSNTNKAWPSSAKFLQFPSNAQVVGKESLHKFNSTKMAELQTRNNDAPAPAAAEKKGFPASGAIHTAVPNTNTSQKRTAPAPVVGWPPIRSFRKNLASTKPSPPDTQNGTHDKLTNHENRVTKATSSSTAKGLFVKINMDGIPIGRKVDLNAYDSYEKLSSAVDKLFRGLLAAQTDSFANGIPSNLVEDKPIKGLLDGSGEYTLVYVDNEGDMVLVGDVPWGMFVSTVKRLRALKTSELASLSRESRIPSSKLRNQSFGQ